MTNEHFSDLLVNAVDSDDSDEATEIDLQRGIGIFSKMKDQIFIKSISRLRIVSKVNVFIFISV